MAMAHTMDPTTYRLSPIDAAVLLKKYVVLLGMINYGTIEQKKVARAEIIELDQTIRIHLNTSAFIEAEKNLGISETEINALL